MAIISRQTGTQLDFFLLELEAMGLSSVQEYLFSYLNLKKVIPLKLMVEILEESLNTLGLDTSSVKEKLAGEIIQINNSIQKYNLEIVELTDEITCEELVILVNIGGNKTGKSLFYNESTVHFFSKIVEECVLSEEGYLSETHCLNLNTQTKITKSEAQCILDKLIKDKWLDSTNDKISLGMRSIAELEQNIKLHFPNDVKTCPFCKLLVVQGYICKKCKIKCHYACWKKYFKLSKKNCLCPSCKELWNDIPAHLVIENSQEERDTIISNHPQKKKKRST